LGIMSRLLHTFEVGGGSGSRKGPTPGPPSGPNARNAGRWLVYGTAALILLWAMGYVWQGVAGLGSAGQPAGTASSAGGDAAAAGLSPASLAQGDAAGGAREYEQALASELESVLSEVRGAGRVRIALSLERGPVYVLGNNTSEDSRTTEEKDASGGVRTVTEVSTTREPVIVRDDKQAERALVTEEERPTVSGVLVLAEGADDSKVRLNLVRAVQALFPLPTHRITVLPMGR